MVIVLIMAFNCAMDSKFKKVIMKQIFLSYDNKYFDDEISCARYELQTQPDLVAQIDDIVKDYPNSFQTRWCGGGPCACMGCINSQFYLLGLTKSHWQIWKDEFRVVGPTTLEQDMTQPCTVYILSAGPNRINVIKYLREFRKISFDNIKNILGETDTKTPICENETYMYVKNMIEKLQSLGATLEIKSGEELNSEQNVAKIIKILKIN